MMSCIGKCVKKYGLLDPRWTILKLFSLSPSSAFVSSDKHFSSCLTDQNLSETEVPRTAQ
jgi:hypothetical protein